MTAAWEWVTWGVGGIVRFVDEHPKTTLILFVILISAVTYAMWG